MVSLGVVNTCGPAAMSSGTPNSAEVSRGNVARAGSVAATDRAVLGLVGLASLMERTSGIHTVVVGLVDGPVYTNHPDLAEARIHSVQGSGVGACAQPPSAACEHGTHVALMEASGPYARIFRAQHQVEPEAV